MFDTLERPYSLLLGDQYDASFCNGQRGCGTRSVYFWSWPSHWKTWHVRKHEPSPVLFGAREPFRFVIPHLRRHIQSQTPHPRQWYPGVPAGRSCIRFLLLDYCCRIDHCPLLYWCSRNGPHLCLSWFICCQHDKIVTIPHTPPPFTKQVLTSLLSLYLRRSRRVRLCGSVSSFSLSAWSSLRPWPPRCGNRHSQSSHWSLPLLWSVFRTRLPICVHRM